MKERKSSKENTSRLFHRYVWLVDLIYRAGGITYEEVNDHWMRSSLNDSGDELPLRTFHNHREAVMQMFDINIECDKRNGYKYHIENSEDMERGGVKQWLLNTFAVNNLINESHKMKSRILFEHIPSGQQHLTTIIEAMRDGAVLEVGYCTFGGKPFSMELHPYFVKVFMQRWYVIGYNPHNDSVRIYSLDRIENIVTTDREFKMPKDFEPENYFADCFGVDRGEEADGAERVVLKISARQAKYLRALPMHHSQTEEETTEKYSLFSYYLRPRTYDFKQAILGLANQAEVLAPQSLRDEIRTIVSELNAKYGND